MNSIGLGSNPIMRFSFQKFLCLLVFFEFLLASCSSLSARSYFTFISKPRLAHQRNRADDLAASAAPRCRQGSDGSALRGSISNNISSMGNSVGDILLCMKFSIADSSRTTEEDDKIAHGFVEELRSYVRSFPFAAILPVQPLQYLPTELGVTITFMRKKTAEKGMQDGGIQIEIIDTNGGVEVDDDEEEVTTVGAEALITSEQIFVQLTASRMVEGQTVSKIFSEKIVALKLLEGIRMWVTKQEGALSSVQLTSVYHKWMDVVTS